MNGYAALAFAMPVVAMGLGWLAVAWHRRSLKRAAPADATRGGRDLDAQLAALQAQLDETAKGAASLRARLDDEARERARRKAAGAGGEVAAAG